MHSLLLQTVFLMQEKLITSIILISPWVYAIITSLHSFGRHTSRCRTRPPGKGCNRAGCQQQRSREGILPLFPFLSSVCFKNTNNFTVHVYRPFLYSICRWFLQQELRAMKAQPLKLKHLAFTFHSLTHRVLPEQKRQNHGTSASPSVWHGKAGEVNTTPSS